MSAVAMTTPAQSSSGALPCVLGASLVTALVLGLLGAWPTGWLAGADGQRAMVLALPVCLFGAWCGSILPAMTLGRVPGFVRGYLTGLGLRFGVTLALLVVIRFKGWTDPFVLLIWGGIGQTVLLAVDTCVLLALHGARWRQAA